MNSLLGIRTNKMWSPAFNKKSYFGPLIGVGFYRNNSPVKKRKFILITYYFFTGEFFYEFALIFLTIFF